MSYSLVRHLFITLTSWKKRESLWIVTIYHSKEGQCMRLVTVMGRSNGFVEG